jgi:hypothetical protein
MQFETPQYIDVEDKIFGQLSWRQFIYLFGGVGIAVALFFIAHIVVFILFGIPIGLLGLALAFYPVNNRPFINFLEAIFVYLFGKRFYLWKQHTDVVYKNELRSVPENQVFSTPNRSQSTNQYRPSSTKRLELELLQENFDNK